MLLGSSETLLEAGMLPLLVFLINPIRALSTVACAPTFFSFFLGFVWDPERALIGLNFNDH